MKTNKKPPKSATSKRKPNHSPLKLFFMHSIRTWCDEPKSRAGKTSRKKELAKILQKDVQTLKNMYLYGQGPFDHWFKAMDHIGLLKQETIIKMYTSYPYLENKLNSLSEEELKFLKYIKELSQAELFLINRLIETGLKVNRELEE
jgi:hypothetical protein